MREKDPQEKGVCAWCRHTFDRGNGVRIRKLSDKEFAAFRRDGEPTHGICASCSKDTVEEAMAVRSVTERRCNDDEATT